MIDLTEERQLYPRVSDILAPYSRRDFENIPLETLTKAAERGTQVHKLCTGYALGLWLPDIQEEHQPYFDKFKLWYDENVDKTILAEIRLYDDDRRFSGEADLYIRLKDGSCTLLDLKTSAKSSRSWIVQLAAYRSLFATNKMVIEKVLNLHLDKTKEKAIEIYHSEQDLTQAWDIVEGLIKAYDFFIRKPLKRGVLSEKVAS